MKNLKSLPVLLCFTMTVFLVKAQDSFQRNTFFLEAGGMGPYYSINYDHVFRLGAKLNYSYRIGFSVLPDAVSLPLGLNVFTGTGNNHIEFSAGFTTYVEHYATAFSSKEDTDKMGFVCAGAGYRYQRPDGGLFFTAGLTPLLLLDPRSDNFWKMDPRFYPSAHLGLGITF